LAFVLAIVVGMFIPATSLAAGKVRVEAVGFFSHPPMQPVLESIQSTCEGFGDKVELILHDETTDEGQQFLSKVGLSGHIPMALFVDGKIVHLIDGKTVTFRDFPGETWSADDLKKVIELRLKDVDTAAKDQSPGLGQTNQSLPMQPNSNLTTGNSQPDAGTSTQDTPSNSNNLFLYGMFGAIALLVVAVIYFFTDRKHIRKRRG
jgi:hypothetical protein